MSTSAQLIVQVKSEGLDATIAKLKQLDVTVKSLTTDNDAQTKSSLEVAKATKLEAQAAIATTNAVTAELRQRKELANALNAESRARQAAIREQRLEQGSHRTSSGLVGALTTQVISLAAAYVSVQGAARLFNETIQAAASYQTLERQLEFLTGGSVADATKELGYLTDVSNRYGTVLLQSTESYAALASAMKMSGISMQGVHQTYEALSAVSATYALSQDKVNAIMLAFTQIAGKGRVQSEELVRQLGQYIPALQLGAKAMGMSIQEFNKALKDGSVASDEFLPKFSALINEMYGQDLERKTDTITASMNRLTTAWQEFLNTSANTGGIVSAWRAIIDATTTALNIAAGNDPRKFIEDYAESAVQAKDKIDTLKDGAGALFTLFNRGGGNIFFLKDVPDQVESVSDAFKSLFGTEKLATEKLEEFTRRAASLNSEQLKTGIAAIKARAAASGDLTYGSFDTTTGARSETWNKQSASYDALIILNKAYNDKIIEQDKESEKQRLEQIDALQSSIMSRTDSFLDDQVKSHQSATFKLVASYNSEIYSMQQKLDQMVKLKATSKDLYDAEAKIFELRASRNEAIVYGIDEATQIQLTNQEDIINKKYDDMVAGITAGFKQPTTDVDRLVGVLLTEDDVSTQQDAIDKIETARERALSEYRTKQSEAYDNTIEQARIATLDEVDAIRAGADLKKAEMEKYFGESQEKYDAWEKLYDQYIDHEVEKVKQAEEDKTKALTAQLLKRYGKYTPEGVSAQFYEQRKAANTLPEGEDKSSVLSGIDIAENEARIKALQDSYQVEQDQLDFALESKSIAEDTYYSRSLAAREAYEDAMKGLVGGNKVILTEEMGAYAGYASQLSSLAAGMEGLAKEGSATQKAFFLTSKALAVTSIIMNAHMKSWDVAATTPGLFGMTAKATILALGYAEAALVAAQTVSSFATGGYTGSGGKYEKAGDVHKGEDVWTQEDVRAAGGPAAAERIRKTFGAGGSMKLNWTGTSYASGGPVYAAPTPTINSSSNVSVPITINNSTDSEITTTRRRVNGQDVIEIAVAQAKADILNDMQGRNGSFSSTLRNTWGLK